MIRILCVQADHSASANVGGPVVTTGKTFDINFPEFEKWLAEKQQWIERSVVAVESLPQPDTEGE